MKSVMMVCKSENLVVAEIQTPSSLDLASVSYDRLDPERAPDKLIENEILRCKKCHNNLSFKIADGHWFVAELCPNLFLE